MTTSWYEPYSIPSGPTEEELEVNTKDDIRPSPSPKDRPSSTELSRSHETSNDQSTSRRRPRLDKGKGKMPEYEVDHPDESDSNVSAPLLDSEFGVPIMVTPRVKKALTLANKKLCRSSLEKNPVTQFGYKEFMIHHYVFTMKVAEPKGTGLRHKLEEEESKLSRKSRTEADEA